MAQDLTGLLGGALLPAAQPITPTSAADYTRIMQEANKGFRQGVGGMFGIDTRTTPEFVQEEAVKLDPTKVEDQAKLVELIGKVDPSRALALKSVFAQQAEEMRKNKIQSDQQIAERGALADYLELEYGDKAKRLRPAVMSGSINASNFDKVFKAEEKSARTPRNVTYTDAQGNTQKQLVFMDTQGKTYNEAGYPIVLPDDAQLTITGQTEQDIKQGVSGFSPREMKNVRDDILSSRAQLRTLAPITEEAIDTYLSLLGRGKAAVGKALSSFTGLGGEGLNKFIKKQTGGTDLIEFAGEQGVLFGALENYFNKKKHDITGAAAAASELKAIRKGLLSGELEPTVAKARLKAVIEEEQYKLDTNFGLLTTGGIDVKSYFDNDKENTTGSTGQEEGQPAKKSELSAPKMESANNIRNLLSGYTVKGKED